ncbi:MAG: FHA domain-containing protein [Vulcanimicrobiaceae bacterium]
MTFEAHMHVVSLQVVAALFLVAAAAARPRPRGLRDIGVLTPLRLALEVGEAAGTRRYEGLCPIAIGRSSGCDLVLEDPEVSRRHARLEAENGVPYVRDLGSSNGTFLNGRLLDDVVEIRRGDEIDVGATRLTVRAIEEVWT